MNDLSWLIYFAGVSENAGSVAAIGLLIIGVVTAFVVIFHAMEEGSLWPPFWRTLGAWLALALVASLIPNRDTLYAIAASEIGEEVVKSETAGKAMKALDAWLDHQIEGEPEK